jgi:acetyl-CoA C-acetyltransferase
MPARNDVVICEPLRTPVGRMGGVLAQLSAAEDRLNPNGSGISLGHPIGATGARILATAAYEARRREARYVLETMCIGGGQGIATVLEAVR